jgi:hypothetical protein
MKCNICGKDDATNYTWSNEMICDDCVNWIANVLHDPNDGISNIIYESLFEKDRS